MWKELLLTVLTSLLSLIVLFLLTKLMGNKQISQLSMFDYIVGITIGSVAAELATELEQPLKPLIAMVIYGLIATGISVLTDKSIKIRRFITGRPAVLMDAGSIYRENLKTARLDIGDFMTMARAAGYFNLSDIESAILEENGTVSFLQKEGIRPLTPADMNLYPNQRKIPVILVEDGRVIVENLVYLNRDGEWLRKELKSLGYASAEEVFFASADETMKVTAFGIHAQNPPPPV